MKTIKLTNGAEVMVDDDDFDRLADFKWIHAGRGYAIRSKMTNRVVTREYMHRVIAGASKGQTVDHVNGNTADNRKQNLRICSHGENLQNRKVGKKHLKGIWKMPCGIRWRAMITAGKRRHYLGVFDSELDAAKAYNEAAVRLHGQFARLNPV